MRLVGQSPVVVTLPHANESERRTAGRNALPISVADDPGAARAVERRARVNDDRRPALILGTDAHAPVGVAGWRERDATDSDAAPDLCSRALGLGEHQPIECATEDLKARGATLECLSARRTTAPPDSIPMTPKKPGGFDGDRDAHRAEQLHTTRWQRLGQRGVVRLWLGQDDDRMTPGSEQVCRRGARGSTAHDRDVVPRSSLASIHGAHSEVASVGGGGDAA